MSDETNQKPFVALWDYQNSNETSTRRLALDVTPLMLSESHSEEQKQALVSAMDQAIRFMIQFYDLMPRPGTKNNVLEPETEVVSSQEK
jgi:predicted helicase